MKMQVCRSSSEWPDLAALRGGNLMKGICSFHKNLSYMGRLYSHSKDSLFFFSCKIFFD